MRIITIDICRKLAQSFGGECLSGSIVNSSIPLRWRCAYGDEFERSYSSIVHEKIWCLVCKKSLPKTSYSLSDCKQLAYNRDGECLSIEYKNNNQLLKWRCNIHNKTWHSSFKLVIRGSWCILCKPRKKITIKYCKEVAEINNSICLSIEYKRRIPLRWKCKLCRHKWDAKFKSMSSRIYWCLNCSSLNIYNKSLKFKF
jgi:hypothetical protein